MHVCGYVSACVRVCECLRLSLQSTLCWQESDKRHDLSLTTSGVCSCLFGSGTSGLYSMMFQTSPYMGILHEYMYVRMIGCTSTPLYVHVTHTKHTHTRTYNTHLFRSLCHHFGCMRTPGGTTCWHLHSTCPRSRVRFFVKLIGGMWSVCDRSWISVCYPTCRTGPGPHTVFTKFIMCATCAVLCH